MAAAITAPISSLDPGHTFESFMNGSGTQFAYAAAERVAEPSGGGYNPFVIFGSSGLGKTHLLHAIGNRIRRNCPGAEVVLVEGGSLVAGELDDFRAPCEAFLLDDLDALAGDTASQRLLLWLLRRAGEDCQVVATASRYPKDIPGLHQDVIDRLMAPGGLTADIQPPHTESKLVLLRHWTEKRVVLPDEIAYELARAARSPGELRRLLEGVLARSELTHAPLTLALLYDCPGFGVPELGLDPAVIAAGVATFFGVELADVNGPRRSKRFVVPRQIAMFLIRMNTGLSLPDTGRLFGGRDHTTVIHAVKKLRAARAKDPELYRKLLAVAEHLELSTEAPES